MNLQDLARNPLLLGRNRAYGLHKLIEAGHDGSNVDVWVLDEYDTQHGYNTSNVINDEVVGLCRAKVTRHDLPANHTLIDVEKAIKYAVDNGAEVISLSISGTGNFRDLYKAVRYAYEKHVPIICSAGNTGEQYPDDVSITRYPGAYEETICVGSVGNDFEWSEFESHSSDIDIVAFGELITTEQKEEGVYVLTTGTSLSTPVVAAIVACIVSMFKNTRIKVTVDSVKEYLYDRCVDLGVLGKDNFYGYGFPTMDILAFKEVRRELGIVERVIKLTIGENKFTVDGKEFMMDTRAIIDENNRTLIPLRAIAEALGCKVEWEHTTRQVTIID